MQSRPFITIGIPTYNRLEYLRAAVESARAQTYPNFEILISQNPHAKQAIRNEISQYCSELAAADSRIRYQLRTENLGPPENFNSIADNARGEYLALMGDDDRMLPNALEILAGALGPETVLAFGRRYIIDSNGNRKPPEHIPDPAPEQFEGWPRAQYRVPPGRLANAELWAWRQAMGTETSLIRTADFRRIRFREDLDLPDIETYILLAREGGEFVFVPEYVMEYRLHDNSTTGRLFLNFPELVEDLAPLKVSPEVEQSKRHLLELMTFNAISRCLLNHEIERARRLRALPYAPGIRQFGAKTLIMALCISMPAKVGPQLYNFLYGVKNRRAYQGSRAVHDLAA